MIVKVSYNKDVYGEKIEKTYESVKQILHSDNLIFLQFNNGLRMKEFKVNETFKLEVSVENE